MHVLESRLEYFGRLGSHQQANLLSIVQILYAEKDWVGCGGLELTEDMVVVIAAQAGTLLLGLDHDYYRNVESILVYPSGYQLEVSAHGPVVGSETRAVLGHAQLRGPVVLSWRHSASGGRDADDGKNLVYHEFAHKLDMLDGAIDGTPILPNRRALRRWIDVMTDSYERLQNDARKGRKSLLDHYGATDVGEFLRAQQRRSSKRADK